MNLWVSFGARDRKSMGDRVKFSATQAEVGVLVEQLERMRAEKSREIAYDNKILGAVFSVTPSKINKLSLRISHHRCQGHMEKFKTRSSFQHIIHH